MGNQIVVGGPFLHGHKIEVGTRDSGVLTVDGQPVMSTFPSSYHGAGFTLTYNAQGEVPDVIPEGNEKRIVHMDLPLDVKVRVYQWGNYVDVEIEMSPQPQQDGVCGNFNGNHADDTTQSVIQRVGARVLRCGRISLRESCISEHDVLAHKGWAPSCRIFGVHGKGSLAPQGGAL